MVRHVPDQLNGSPEYRQKRTQAGVADAVDHDAARRKWLVLVAVGLGTFMSALDGSVVSTLLPVIQTYFGTSVATVEWVVTIYLLVVSGLLLTFGRLGDLRGNRTVYVWGFGTFVLGSALAALSPSAVQLILSRAVQAVGATMLFANAPAILTRAFPSSERGRALGLGGTITYLGLTTGPFLGGWLANTFSWHAAFFINVPIGIVATWLSLRVIPVDVPTGSRETFDVYGAFTFTAGLIALLVGLNQGHNWGWFSYPTLGLMAASILVLAAFVWIERRTAAPMLDLDLFKDRVFRLAAASPVLNYLCVYSILFLMPFYLIQARGLTSAEAGLLLTTQPLVMATMAPVSGTLSDKIGSRLPTSLGMLILSVGLFLLTRLGMHSPLRDAVAGLAVCGLGVGIFVAPNNSALMGAAPRRRQGIASGVLALGRNVGMVLGIGLTGAVFTTVLGQSETLLTPNSVVPASRAGFFFACCVALAAAGLSFARGDDRPGPSRAPAIVGRD
jgi:EmrB/QacA subfamily drug resistance transporter